MAVGDHKKDGRISYSEFFSKFFTIHDYEQHKNSKPINMNLNVKL